MRYFVFLAAALAAIPAMAQKLPVLPSGATLYVAPMEWNLDRSLTAELERQAVPVRLVGRPEEADFVMTSQYQALGSHLMSPGHYIQVRIAAANGREVWFTEANDYALMFGRLRPHGPDRVARDVARKLYRRMRLAQATR